MDRNWSRNQRTLDRDGVTNRDISIMCGESLSTVNRALCLDTHGRVSHASVLAVRAAINTLTHGEVSDWSEYDEALTPSGLLSGLQARTD